MINYAPKPKHQIISIGSLATIAILSGIILASSNIHADDVVDEINITVPVSCSLSGTGMNTHNTEINNGQYNSAIGETTIKAFCNDNNGFAIYAIGYTDNEDGKNVLTSSALGSTYDIATGTATSGATSNWAMKLSTISSPTPTYPITIQNSFDSFQEVPDDYTLVAKRTSDTDIGTGAEGSTLKSTYQAYISPTQPAGTYTGQVKYTLVHPNDATKPVKPIACNPSGTTISEVLCLQDISSTNKTSILASMTESQKYTLADNRDGELYGVAKLPDGNIWLLDNLKLDPTDSSTASRMDETNTNAPAAAIANYFSGNNPDNTQGWTNEPVTNKTVSDWNDVSPNNAYEFPYINNEYKDTNVTNFGDNNGKAGLYYNICAASVGTYCYDSASYYDAPDSRLDAQYDLCPINWQIPIDDTYSNLMNAITGEEGYITSESSIVTFANGFSATYTGRIKNSSMSGYNENASFWASTVVPGYSNNAMFSLEIFPNIILPVYGGERNAGIPIRCVIK